MILREHGLTLSEWAHLSKPDKRFLREGAAEYAERKQEAYDDA